MATAPRYFSGITDEDRDDGQAQVFYDEAFYDAAIYNHSFPTHWHSGMDTMLFMDALQPWAPPTTNDPRPVTMGLAWQQQQPSPLVAWDMHFAPMNSPYPVQSDPSYERAVFKSEKPLEETWGSGWVDEIPTSLDTIMQPVGPIPQALAINMPVQRPPPAPTVRKRRRVPSPMVDMSVFTSIKAERATTSPDTPFTAPHKANTLMRYEHGSVEPPSHPEPPIPHFQPRNGERSHPQQSTPPLEEWPEYGTADIQSQPSSSGPVATSSGPTSKFRRGTHAVFKTQSAKSKRGHYASDVWEGHKFFIKKLYIDEGRPLREVIRIMETEHNFPASQRMYKARFKQWGFVKNNTEKVVSQILRTKFERDAAGKLSHFTRNGKDVNLQDYLQRKGLTEYDLVDFASGTDSNSSEHSGDSNSDAGARNALLAHVRCRTPPTDVPSNLRMPDRLRFQDTFVMSFKRAFLLWRQEEQEQDFGLFQPSVFTWRVTDFPHISKLMESARLIRSGDDASGVAALNQAFWCMNDYLKSMDATASFYFFFHRQSRPWQQDARIALAVWKFLAAYASARNHNNHPLLHTFKLMYEVIQKEGVRGLRELLTESSNAVADELERAFGREHWLKDLIWHRCFPEKSKLRNMQLIRDLRDHGPTKKFVKKLC